MLKKVKLSLLGLVFAAAALLTVDGGRGMAAGDEVWPDHDQVHADEPKTGFDGNNGQPHASRHLKAEATLRNAKGQAVGKAHFVEINKGVLVHVKVKGLAPGLHGIHFHEKGSCQPPKFLSAGEHFNPFYKEHGLENPKGPHAGDLKNLVVNHDGMADATFVTPRVTLAKGKKNALIDADGTALVIHAKPDDQKTNPTGGSGDRIICGVIKSVR